MIYILKKKGNFPFLKSDINDALSSILIFTSSYFKTEYFK